MIIKCISFWIEDSSRNFEEKRIKRLVGKISANETRSGKKTQLLQNEMSYYISAYHSSLEFYRKLNRSYNNKIKNTVKFRSAAINASHQSHQTGIEFHTFKYRAMLINLLPNAHCASVHCVLPERTERQWSYIKTSLHYSNPLLNHSQIGIARSSTRSNESYWRGLRCTCGSRRSSGLRSLLYLLE